MSRGFLIFMVYLHLYACFPTDLEEIRYQDVSNQSKIVKVETNQSVFNK